MPQTVAGLLRSSLTQRPSAPAQRFLRDGTWQTRTYGSLDRVSAIAAHRLAEAGVVPGDRIGLMLRTRADWTVVEIAAARLGAALVPIYPTSTAQQVAELLEWTKPRVLIVSSDAELQTTGIQTAARVLVVGADDGDLGDLAETLEQGDVVAAWGQSAPDDVFTIAFSSGSTGRPKGCVILQRNYSAVLEMVVAAENHPTRAHAHRTSAFIYLPLAHASARLQQLTSLCLGGEIIYGEGSAGTAGILRQIQDSEPSYVAGVPRLFEQAARHHAGDSAGLRAAFGANLIYALSGGAPLAHDVLDAYAEAGVAIVDGYGLTESSTAVAIGTPHSYRRGTVGRPLPGLNIRIAEDGEVLVQGPNVFAGYLDDPSSTAQVLRDGWLHTGDFGELDERGFLAVTGRKKNLIVTSTGKNISPEAYENAFRAESGVEDFLLVGDRRPYVIGIVAPHETLPVNAQMLQSVAAQLNASLAPQERVQKIVILDAPLRQDAGEITASGKAVRSAVEFNHRRAIAGAYAGDAAIRLLHVEDRSGGIAAAGIPIAEPATEGV